jgi:hypothetical protein
MGSDNFLLEWFDPSDDVSSSSDYRFDHIYVTIRAYGIPRNRRSIDLLVDILNQVGSISEFHILQDSNLFAKQDYIWGTAKLQVNSPIKDRAIVRYADNATGLAYLNYEKIGRICLFCGIMFHNVQHCNIRNNLISERSRNRQQVADIPIQRFGKWIIDDKYIPTDIIQTTRIGNVGNTQSGNAILERLQKHFADDPKGKRKSADEQMISSKFMIHGNFSPPGKYNQHWAAGGDTGVSSTSFLW